MMELGQSLRMSCGKWVDEKHVYTHTHHHSSLPTYLPMGGLGGLLPTYLPTYLPMGGLGGILPTYLPTHLHTYLWGG